MKIALDAMGGDFAPKVNIEGAKMALQELDPEIKLVLLGDEAILKPLLSDLEVDPSRFEIVHTTQIIEMGEHPTKALTLKQDSGIVRAFAMLKAREIDAFCGTGNTGAMHVGSMFSVKTIEGIIRPGLAGFVPKESGNYGIILDVGANADCKPDVLYQFGVIGCIYAKNVLEIPNPKIGLMNLGEEEQKGSLHTQAAYQLFKINSNLNFIGNIEGRDLFNDKADVIVCDGFTGNVILKLVESIFDLLKKRNFVDEYFERFNYEAIGGSPILGINGNVIIGHGASTAQAVKSMILQARDMAKADIHTKIKNNLDF